MKQKFGGSPSHFNLCAAALVAVLQRNGITKCAFKNPELGWFKELPLARRHQIVEMLSDLIDLTVEMEEAGEDLAHSRLLRARLNQAESLLVRH